MQLSTEQDHCTFQIIVMSATINTKLFADYFAQPVGRNLEPAPVVNILEVKRPYRLTEHYLDEVVQRTGGKVQKLNSGSVAKLGFVLRLSRLSQTARNRCV